MSLRSQNCLLFCLNGRVHGDPIDSKVKNQIEIIVVVSHAIINSTAVDRLVALWFRG